MGGWRLGENRREKVGGKQPALSKLGNEDCKGWNMELRNGYYGVHRRAWVDDARSWPPASMVAEASEIFDARAVG